MARFRIVAAVLTAAVASGLTSPVRAQGSLFTTSEVDQTKFVMVAAPIGSGSSAQLNIYEQRTNARPCFEMSGSAPAVVNPMLATFDFTGICNRYIDGNGYSLRIGGDDLGTRYRLSVIKSANDVQLMAVPTRDPSQPSYLIAKAGGAGNGFIQLVLEPGWRLMRRQYGKRTLGHLYVYRDAAPAEEAP
ncbi:uncharacterized conserved secreted protein (DUF3747) [Synechococcus sp. PROS-7-1]|uniref:DUF3747 domain-containing protein n=1 Tax=Synechococcus sp. PROS-7-1 TaxID=1442556 RepID=UPI001644E77C|nr:DUF3747 domain-containing protein [Synechococcus sp. PROS-7-1]MBL6798018.1 DUF3747 domain-containing protein [Synechococcus sp. BS307-5m-G39]MBL6800952.1 DUF3747 domain-containing protein [Synechococcus sp. BS307-5m-G37]QNI86192.1 uncharacterized conserved secreted protein (DUF3747) [Synechococcus sp. PROS-7-1]